MFQSCKNHFVLICLTAFGAFDVLGASIHEVSCEFRINNEQTRQFAFQRSVASAFFELSDDDSFHNKDFKVVQLNLPWRESRPDYVAMFDGEELAKKIMNHDGEYHAMRSEIFNLQLKKSSRTTEVVIMTDHNSKRFTLSETSTKEHAEILYLTLRYQADVPVVRIPIIGPLLPTKKSNETIRVPVYITCELADFSRVNDSGRREDDPQEGRSRTREVFEFERAIEN